MQSKTLGNEQEPMQSDPTTRPQKLFNFNIKAKAGKVVSLSSELLSE